MGQLTMGPRSGPTETDKTMLAVILTIWLLVQLPVALVLGRFLACPRRLAVKRVETRRAAIAPPGAHAA
jgi:hypothetical protein